MKRGMERFLAQGAWAVFACTVLCAVAVVSLLVARPPVPAEIPEIAPPAPQAPETRSDPLLEKLASTRMTRKVEAPVAAPVKRTVLPLHTLLRLKGVMGFGDPKDNEALIEDLRTNQTKSYRAGQTVPGVNAVVKQVDDGVTLQYEGEDVRLEVPRASEASSDPLTGPGRAVQTVKRP